MKAKIKEIIQETYDTITIQFENKINYFPGQFITIDTKQFPELANTGIGRAQGPRAYSITWPFGVTVKKEENGLFSTFVAKGNLKAGNEIEIKGPFGFFTYAEQRDVFLIGAGSGIVPLYTILSSIAEKKSTASAKLLYSSKTEKDIIFRKQLDKLQAENKNFDMMHILTRADDSWKGRKERIDINLIEDFAKDLKRYIFYICGPAEFGKSIKEAILKKGIPSSNVKLEAWG